MDLDIRTIIMTIAVCSALFHAGWMFAMFKQIKELYKHNIPELWDEVKDLRRDNARLRRDLDVHCCQEKRDG